MDKIKTLDQFMICAKRGFHIRCPALSYMEKWTEAKRFRGLSIGGIQKAIDAGMECREIEPVGEIDVLQDCKAKLKNFTLAEIAKRRGVSVQAVSKFLRASSVSTKTLNEYLRVME